MNNNIIKHETSNNNQDIFDNPFLILYSELNKQGREGKRVKNKIKHFVSVDQNQDSPDTDAYKNWSQDSNAANKILSKDPYYVDNAKNSLLNRNSSTITNHVPPVNIQKVEPRKSNNSDFLYRLAVGGVMVFAGVELIRFLRK